MRKATTLIFLILFSVLPAQLRADLPSLSDGSYGGITLEKEYQLGRNWVRSLRRQAQLMEDPVSSWYMEQLVWQLVDHSQLKDRRLEIVTLDNKAFNAFAVPGGIVGLHGGLMLAAHSEGELASVIAHELAHLSQRHFTAQVAQQRRSQPAMIAGMLAGILLTSVSGDAGIATIAATQAAGIDAQLKFSRRNEREADRIGMQTLANAGYNPHTMPMMFGRLLENYRFATRPPEFLSTHPLSENRIADSEGRAAQLAGGDKTPFKDPRLFSLVKARLMAQYSAKPDQLAGRVKDEIAASKGEEQQRLIYALYSAQISARQFDQATQTFSRLDNSMKKHWVVQLTRAEQLMADQKPAEATAIFEKQLKLYPGNYPLQQRMAEALVQANQIKPALKIYRKLALKRSTDVNIHYQLAEVYGLDKNIAGVHRARVEYFLLLGNIDRALRQIKFARKERGLSAVEIQQLDQLEEEAKEIREQMKLEL